MASAAFDDTNWTGYCEITSDNTKVDEATGDLMYDLSLLPSDWWNAQAVAGGGDVRIVNDAGDTAYSFELENFNNNGDGTGTGVIFFDSQNIATGSDVTWRIYTGNSGASMPAASATLGSENVWESAYQNTAHLGESSGSANDSTSNGNDGTFNGDLPTQASGKLEKGQSLDGTGDYIDFGSYGGDIDNVTLSVWFKNSNTGNYDTFWYGVGGTGQFRSLFSTGNEITFYWKNDTNNQDKVTTNGLSVRDGNWHHLIITRAGSGASNLHIYVDGSEATTTTNYDKGSGAIGTNPSRLVGHDTWDNIYYTGDLDEFRERNDAISANEVFTHYNNQNSPSTFWTTGSWTTEAVDVTVSASTQIATFSQPSAIISADSNLDASLQTATLNFISGKAFSSIDVSASVQTATFNLQSGSQIGDSNITASVNSATFSLLSGAVSIPETVNASVNLATFSFVSPTTSADSNVSASTQSATFSVISGSQVGVSNVSGSSIDAVFSLVGGSISGQASVSASVNTATFSIISGAVSIASNILASTHTLTFSLVNPTVNVPKNIVSPYSQVDTGATSPTSRVDPDINTPFSEVNEAPKKPHSQ